MINNRCFFLKLILQKGRFTDMFLKTFTNERIRRAYIKMLIKAVLSVLCVGIGVFLTVACIVHYQNCEKNVQPLEDSYMYLLGIFIFGLLGVSTVSDNLKAVIRSRSIAPLGINYAKRINEELNLVNAKWFEINKLYITQNYLVVLGSAILFLRKDAITKVYDKTIEDYSQGGLTYVKEIYAEYRDDGETYVISKVPIHSLQKNTLERYQIEQDDIFACLQGNI